MQRKTKFAFNDSAAAQSSEHTEGLTFLIRTDARYATGGFRRQLLQSVQQDTLNATFGPQANGIPEEDTLAGAVKKSVHDAYEEWGVSVLNSISRHVNYDLYDIDESVRSLNVHFHDAHALAEKIANNADDFLKTQPGHNPEVPAVYVSLDEMFHECRAPWAEIAFSRLFSTKGDQQFGYTARPGKMPIEEQVTSFAQSLKDLQQRYGQKLPIVLLEDNVRHAKMLNWVIDLMDKHGVFESGELACISTCFCSASQDERAAIVHQGRSIPLVPVIEINSKSFEVSTPRDLFFDGYVVEVNGEQTRLPGLFMDVEKLFKVSPDKVEAFKAEIKDASVRFCERIEKEWNINVPVAWFTGAKAIASVTGQPLEARMSEVLEKWHSSPAPAMPQAANESKMLHVVS